MGDTESAQELDWQWDLEARELGSGHPVGVLCTFLFSLHLLERTNRPLSRHLESSFLIRNLHSLVPPSL